MITTPDRSEAPNVSPPGRATLHQLDAPEIPQQLPPRLWRRLQPLSIGTMPLDVPPPRTSRFGSPLVLSRVHWVRPELVAEVKFLTWTDDNLLRQVVYEGLGGTNRRPRSAARCRTGSGIVISRRAT
jgi:ATP-dependent DNA ligase